MSKRAGDIYLLDTLLDEIGNDAARWFFASRGTQLDIEVDVELARRQSSENPVYYVQYAHARIASILRKAADAGLSPAPDVAGLLAGEPEALLVRAIARYPEVVEDAVAAQETQGITAYATELATQFHAFYRDARVVDAEQPERSAKRLALALAAMTTLANALALLGISAPDVDVDAGGRPQADQPARPRTFAIRPMRVVRARGHEDHAIGLGRQDRRRSGRAPAASARCPRAPPRTRSASASVSQRVSRTAPVAPSGPSIERDPVAAPAGRRGLGRRAVHAGRVAEHDPQLELAERVLERRPSSRRRAASRGRPGTTPPPAPRAG